MFYKGMTQEIKAERRRVLWAIVWLLFVLLISLQGVGSVMRESDQASLLTGSLDLARDWSPVGRDFYNYDKQWLSYWIVSLGVRFTGVAGGEALSQIVLVGNWTAFIIGFAGLGVATIVAMRRAWSAGLMMCAVLIAPTVLLSLPLLSSNILSVGMLGIWVVSMECLGGRRRNVLALIFVFLAVGCRADAILVLPALTLAWWGVGREWKGLLKSGPVWISIMGAVMALVVGKFLGTHPEGLYSLFFQPLTFSAYLVFGLGGLLFIYIACVLHAISYKQDRATNLRIWAWLLLLLIPVLFYGRILFTPRHLMTASVIIGFSACFSGSQVWWGELMKSKARWLVRMAGVALICPLFVGIKLNSLSSGELKLSNTTLYPTADGLWPMGGYVAFLGKLGNSHQEPIDHNQRVWRAWCQLDKVDLYRNKEIVIRSNGLYSYGELWGEWHGLAIAEVVEKGSTSYIELGDDRTMMKPRVSIAGSVLKSYGEMVDSFEVLAYAKGSRIVSYQEDCSEQSAVIRKVMAELEKQHPRNAFVIALAEEWNIHDFDGNYRWYGFDSNTGDYIKELKSYEEIKSGMLVARSELVSFFSIRAYVN